MSGFQEVRFLMTNARAEFAEWKVVPKSAGPSWFARRGRALEGLIFEILRAQRLEPRLRFRPKGEEIDGSFIHGGRVYLLEAKWTAHPVPASELYAFKGKVDGKLIGTIGVFISIGGYSDDAVDALIAGKTVNLILFDSADLEAALDPEVGFIRVLQTKLRGAAESGSPLVPFEVTTASAASLGTTPLDALDTDLDRTDAQRPALIVCEGRTDAAIISVLVRKALRDSKVDRDVKVVIAGGIYNLPRVALAAETTAGDFKKAVVVDLDNRGEEFLKMLQSQANLDDWQWITVDPNIETSLGTNSILQVESVDIGDLANRIEWVRELSNFLVSPGGKS
jgi:hypothetical protein